MVLGAGGQHEARPSVVRSLGRGLDPRRGDRSLVDRIVGPTGEVLDRTAGDTGGREARDVLGNAARVVGEPVLEVDTDRKVRRVGERRRVLEDLVDRHTAVEPAERCRVTRTRGRDRREAQEREQLRGTSVPRVGQE